jgi:hypothetical protein
MYRIIGEEVLIILLTRNIKPPEERLTLLVGPFSICINIVQVIGYVVLPQLLLPNKITIQKKSFQ